VEIYQVIADFGQSAVKLRSSREFYCNVMRLFISIFTMIISGIRALYENDLKKIIALSTLRQLGLMIIILRLGLNLLGFYHLLTAELPFQQ